MHIDYPYLGVYGTHSKQQATQLKPSSYLSIPLECQVALLGQKIDPANQQNLIILCVFVEFLPSFAQI